MMHRPAACSASSCYTRSELVWNKKMAQGELLCSPLDGKERSEFFIPNFRAFS